MLNFYDCVYSKYDFGEEFSEGLAMVQDLDELCGYINKKGEKVIDCQFEDAGIFSEGLALVKPNDKSDRWGYIDKKGKLRIKNKYEQASNFSDGLAAVSNEDGYWGYINKEGNLVIKHQYRYASPFKDGFAVVQFEYSPQIEFIINKKGEILYLGHYEFSGQYVSIEDGIAILGKSKRRDNKEFKIIDLNKKEIKKIVKIDADRRLSPLKEGMIAFNDSSGKKGYLDKDLNIRIPEIYRSASNFSDGVANIKLEDDFIGFVSKEGKNIVFSRKKQYNEIDRFSEGLSRAQNLENLSGYINKNGEEVIPCQYTYATHFSEGLAFVKDSNGFMYYINKKGEKKIELEKVYTSILELGDKYIFIEASSEKELNEKKLQVLRQVKEEFISSIKDISSDVLGDLYESKNQKLKK